MYQLLFILVGANRVHVVASFASGDVESACESMTPRHLSHTTQTTTAPYKIKTEPISMDELMVSLSANSVPFRGFLLEAEDSKGQRPVGTFTLINPSVTQLLNCGGSTASAVSHTDNFNKNEIKVKWKSPKDGNYTFRATFVQTFRIFWVDELRDPVTTTSPTTITTTAASTTTDSTVTSKPPAITLTTSVINTTAFTTTNSTVTSKPPATTSTTSVIHTTASTMTDSAVTSKPPATTSTTAVSNTFTMVTTSTVASEPPATTLTTFSTTTEMVNLAILLFYGILTRMAGYSHSGLSFRVHVLLMSLFAIGNIIALILVLVEGWRMEAHPVLVCAVTVVTFIQIVVTFLRCGQSHELLGISLPKKSQLDLVILYLFVGLVLLFILTKRFIFNWFHRLGAFAIVCLTVASVFTGLACIEASSAQHMLQKLMGGLVAWELLFYILQFSLSWCKKTDENSCPAKTKDLHTVIQISVLVVFSMGNAAFLVVLLERIFTS